jgi:hypothetical protein
MPGYNYNDKMKNKYHTVGTVPTYNRNFIKTEAKSIPHTHTHTHDRPFPCLGTDISIIENSFIDQIVPSQ